MNTRALWLIAPFATWMLLMAAWPSDVTGYAVRTAVVAALLVVLLCRWGVPRFRPISVVTGFLVGLVVFVIWILPEQFGWSWYARWFIVGEGGTTAVAEASRVMIAVRLVGSAFVIAVAEELFFRKWLIGFAGFWWMVALFAIEHDRWLVGAMAGAVYGVVYLRHGLVAAVMAHATTNLTLGLWVLKTGQWQFW